MQAVELAITAGQLLQAPVTEPTWIVDGLLAAGRKRPSLLVSKPHAGKSTISWQLAIAVCKGENFLGRRTKRGAVLFVSTEETQGSIADRLRALRYDPASHAPLYVLTDENTSTMHMHIVLDQHPEISLVIVETVSDLSNRSSCDTNNARDVTDLLGYFENDWASGNKRAFLLLQHLRKRRGDEVGDGILGSSAFRGRTDTKIFLKKISDEDSRRIVFSENRVGEVLEPTILNFDSATGRNELSVTVAQDRANKREQTSTRIRTEILEFFQANPNSSFEAECAPMIRGYRDAVRKEFKRLLDTGAVIRTTGTGKKGSPLLYSVAKHQSAGAIQ